MKTFLLTTTAAVLIGAPVLAGSLEQPTTEAPVMVPPAPVVTTYDWSGPYVGATGGWLMGNSTLDPPGTAVDIDGALSYGAFAGYNFQSGPFVYGGEIAATMYDGFPVGSPTATYDYILDGKLRAGYAMDNVLVYGFAGPSFASFTDAGANQYNLWGANFGVGAEYGVTDNLSLGLEYNGHYLTGDTAVVGETQTDWLHGVQGRVSLRF